eukprot:TRINITY_DN3442_c1_g1_i4.p1 TRINITY_DN3442_c1_g1~~TRINITY_DN3442_c1_g1_i4.p1  ORF type:complete len:148 (-),score=33.99 TRINITY_DN3442_c1_g1_i4:21-464(-)
MASLEERLVECTCGNLNDIWSGAYDYVHDMLVNDANINNQDLEKLSHLFDTVMRDQLLLVDANIKKILKREDLTDVKIERNSKRDNDYDNVEVLPIDIPPADGLKHEIERLNVMLLALTETEKKQENQLIDIQNDTKKICNSISQII